MNGWVFKIDEGNKRLIRVFKIVSKIPERTWPETDVKGGK